MIKYFPNVMLLMASIIAMISFFDSDETKEFILSWIVFISTMLFNVLLLKYNSSDE